MASMIPIDQDIFSDHANGIRGNCMQAATASLLELPLDRVPNFHLCSQGFWQGFHDFIHNAGYEIECSAPDDFPADQHYLAYGPGPRGVSHAVIYYNGELAHDPHPSRTGLLKVHEINSIRRTS